MRLLPAADERPDTVGRVRPDAEAEPPAPRQADEVGAVDAELVEHGRRVPGPQRHRVGGRLVVLVAAT